MPKRKQGLKDYFQQIMDKEIAEIRQLPFEEADSLTGKTSTGQAPIAKYRLYFRDAGEKEVIVKRKSSKIIRNGIRLLNYKNSLKLYYYLARHHKILSFDQSFLREIAFYHNIGEERKENLPLVYGTYHNQAENQYIIVMREFSPKALFSRDLVYAVLESILPFHISFYGKKEVIEKFKLNCYSTEDYKKSRPLLRALFRQLEKENALYFAEDLPLLYTFIDEIHQKRAELSEHFSLTHNDFGPRNLCFDGQKIIVYDWELAAYQNPEHDFIEYLCFVLHEFSDEEVRGLIEYYRNRLFTALGLDMDKEEYQKILEFNISEFIVNKLSVYRMSAKTYALDFIEDLCVNAARLFRMIRREAAIGRNHKESERIYG